MVVERIFVMVRVGVVGTADRRESELETRNQNCRGGGENEEARETRAGDLTAASEHQRCSEHVVGGREGLVPAARHTGR